MFKNKSTLILAGLAGLFATMTHAENGLYAGFNLGQSTLAHEIQRDSGSKDTPSITTRTEDSDFNVTLNLGYHYNFTESWFAKVEGFYSFENASTLNKNNLLVTKIDLNATYGVTLKPGYKVTEDFSVYGIFGLVALDFDIDNSYPFAPPMRSDDDVETGFQYGFGAEVSVADGWSILVEYVTTKDVSFDPIPEVAVEGKINPNELDLATFNVGVRYLF